MREVEARLQFSVVARKRSASTTIEMVWCSFCPCGSRPVPGAGRRREGASRRLAPPHHRSPYSVVVSPARAGGLPPCWPRAAGTTLGVSCGQPSVLGCAHSAHPLHSGAAARVGHECQTCTVHLGVALNAVPSACGAARACVGGYGLAAGGGGGGWGRGTGEVGWQYLGRGWPWPWCCKGPGCPRPLAPAPVGAVLCVTCTTLGARGLGGWPPTFRVAPPLSPLATPVEVGCVLGVGWLQGWWLPGRCATRGGTVVRPPPLSSRTRTHTHTTATWFAHPLCAPWGSHVSPAGTCGGLRPLVPHLVGVPWS